MYPTETQEQIAARIGMTADAFSRALNGKRGFAAVELARLADLLQTSMYWLTTGQRDPHEPLMVARHTFDQATLSRSVDWAGLTRAVDDVRLAYSQVALPSSPPVTAAGAREMRALLGEGFIAEFADRVEACAGVDVVRVKGVHTAVAMRLAGRSVIVMGETGNWFYQNWSLAHELGHFVLRHVVADAGTEVPEHVTDRQEADANAFAAELLLPADEVRGCDWAAMTAGDLAELVWGWGVSTDALATRLRALRIEVPAHVSLLLGERAQRLLRHHWSGNRETVDLITQRMDHAASRRFPSVLQAAHVEAIAAGRAPKATLAWMLGVEESEVEVDEPVAESADLGELAQALGLTDLS